jgi:hypothetical protein
MKTSMLFYADVGNKSIILIEAKKITNNRCTGNKTHILCPT